MIGSCADAAGARFVPPPRRRGLRGLVVLVLAMGLWLQDPESATGQALAESASFRGRYGFTVTGGTLRAFRNASGDLCTTVNSGSAVLSGIPSGAVVEAAYLYWAGSGSVADNNVTFNGVKARASRTFSDVVVDAGNTFAVFGGVKDVARQVAGNGTYTFSDLAVNGGEPYCSKKRVFSGWGLVVVYSGAGLPVGEIRIADGMRVAQYSTVGFTFTGLNVTQGDDVSVAVLAWEGDEDANDASEAVTFNGSVLSDQFNPAGRPFNSTITNVNTLVSSSSWGVDLDTYDVSSLIGVGGTTTAAVEMSVGRDWIVANAVVFAGGSNPRLTIGKSAGGSGARVPGTDVPYSITVGNSGATPAVGVRVVDSVPATLVFKVGSVGQNLPAGVTVAVEYSADGGATWTYVPVSGGCGVAAGYDGCVNRVRWVFGGDFPAAGGGEAMLSLVARVR